MSVRLPPFPLAFLLAAATLVSWWFLVFGGQAGVSVANQSGEVLRQVQVCLTGAGCVVRENLWPHEVWKVDVPDRAAGQVRLVTPQGDLESDLSERESVQFVVKRGGNVKIE